MVKNKVRKSFCMSNINRTVQSATQSTQWRGTAEIIDWFPNIKDKLKYTFIVFDIAELDPFTYKELLQKSLAWCKQCRTVTHQYMQIIMHFTMPLLLHGEQPVSETKPSVSI